MRLVAPIRIFVKPAAIVKPLLLSAEPPTFFD
jgi:hypothetical protein